MPDAATVTPSWAAMMAAYNAEMNRRLYAAAARLSDEARRADRGAFFGSIHGTLNHLLWADTMWLSRFDGGPRPSVPGSESVRLFPDFDAMQAARPPLDDRIAHWTTTLTPDFLAGDFTWISGLAAREVTRPTGMVVTHFFNHQTHHRGQVHAMLTACGEKTGDTDLFLVLP